MNASQRFDDLKCIKGIGPVIERRLHKAGVQNLVQLASLSPAELAKQVPSLSSQRIAVESWCKQARRLVAKQSKIRRKQTALGNESRQHYATFTVELLLNNDGSVRRTRVVHVQSETEVTWSDWREAELVDFLATHAGLHGSLPHPDPLLESITSSEPLLTAEAVSQSELTLISDTPLSAMPAITDPVGVGPLLIDQRAILSGVLRLSELAIIPRGFNVSRRIVRAGQVFKVQCVLDLTQVVKDASALLTYKITVLAKKPGEKSSQIVGETQSTTLPADKLPCAAEVTLTSQGTYRLKVIVALTQADKETLPQHRLLAMQTSGLLQAY